MIGKASPKAAWAFAGGWELATCNERAEGRVLATEKTDPVRETRAKRAGNRFLLPCFFMRCCVNLESCKLVLCAGQCCRLAKSELESLQESSTQVLPRRSLPPLHEFVLPNVKDAEPLRSEQIEAFHGVTIDVRRRFAANANEAAMP